MAVAYDAVRAEQVRLKYRNLNRAAVDLLPLNVFDAIPGDADGLLPQDKVRAALDIRIPLFSDRHTRAPNLLTLEWWPNSASDWLVVWEEDIPGSIALPDASFPLSRTIPLNIFENYEGKFLVRYRVRNWQDFDLERESPTVPVTIDRLGPIHPQTPQAVEGTPPVVTTDILVRDGGLKCTIPDFVEDKKDFVRVQVGLMDKPPESAGEFPSLVVFDALLPLDRQVLLPRSYVENFGSKLQYVVYYLFDKAGNRSERSYDKSVQVALGELPSGLSPCRVPLNEDGFIDRADGATPVWVEIDEYGGWETSDGPVIYFGNQTLARTSVGAHGRFPIRINVPWRYVRDAYDFVAGGAQPIVVDYTIYRGDYPTRSPSATPVVLHLAIPGPGSPDPEPINPVLDKLRFLSFSGSDSELTLADKDEPAAASFNLPDGIVAGDRFVLFYNDLAISSPAYVVTGTDIPGRQITFVIPWDDIKLAPVMTGLEMFYRFTRPGFANPQESVRTLIDVLVEVVDLPEPVFLRAFDIGGGYKVFNCNSLVDDGSGAWGVKVRIPPSSYLKAGVVVKFHWQTYGPDGSTELPGTTIDEERAVTAEEETLGMEWFIDYDTYLKPTYLPGPGSGEGKSRYSIEIRGTEEESDLVDIMIGVFESTGSGNDHCRIPRPGP